MKELKKTMYEIIDVVLEKLDVHHNAILNILKDISADESKLMIMPSDTIAEENGNLKKLSIAGNSGAQEKQPGKKKHIPEGQKKVDNLHPKASS